MARPISWIDRIVPITRTVKNSAASHYDRKDLQLLFEIQPRSAQNLMTAMPIVSIGNSHLVEREALIAFLTRLNEADDPALTFTHLRSNGARPLRRKLRAFSLKEVSADLHSLPENLTLKPGEMIVRFHTVDQLAETMVYVAALLQDHLDGFAARYESPESPVEQDVLHQQAVRLDAESIKGWR